MICFNLPNTITTHDNKIYVLIFNFCYVRFCCNHLFLCWKRIILFILTIAQCTTKVQPTIYTTKTHDSACFGDSIYLLWILWFVIFTQLLSLSIHTSHSTRVTSICTVNELWCYQDDISSATSMRLLLIFWTIIDFSHLLLNSNNLLSSCLTENELIHS